jgi:hypothetical protein
MAEIRDPNSEEVIEIALRCPNPQCGFEQFTPNDIYEMPSSNAGPSWWGGGAGKAICPVCGERFEFHCQDLDQETGETINPMTNTPGPAEWFRSQRRR